MPRAVGYRQDQVNEVRSPALNGACVDRVGLVLDNTPKLTRRHHTENPLERAAKKRPRQFLGQEYLVNAGGELSVILGQRRTDVVEARQHDPRILKTLSQVGEHFKDHPNWNLVFTRHPH